METSEKTKSGKTRLPLNMVFQQILAERRRDPVRGGAKGLRLIIGELKHLPPRKDIALSVEVVKKAYLEDIEFGDAELLAHAMKLGMTARSMLEDRENLKAVLECVSDVLEKWNEWLASSESDDTLTEEELQQHFETVATAIAALREVMDGYYTGIFMKLKKRKEALSKKESAPEN
ncbi:MAG: hypothetical protein LBS00_05525 [Synergistaceae bacterium]|nr:hypothetical protein [Synergistaceae bacterium]